jgi:hypothetical protein
MTGGEESMQFTRSASRPVNGKGEGDSHRCFRDYVPGRDADAGFLDLVRIMSRFQMPVERFRA